MRGRIHQAGTTRRSGGMLLATVLAASFLVAGCNGSTTADSSVGQLPDGMTVEGGAPAVAPDGAVQGEATGPKVASPSTVTDRQVVRTGSMAMRAEDVTRTAVQVRDLVRRTGGLIASEDTQASDDATYATITAQIPADRLDGFIAAVSQLGTVDSLNVTAQDVTSQVVDLDARITALKTSIARLTQLLAKAARIEDLLAIETQLSQRQSELDALTAQRTYLADQVALSTMTVSVSPLTTVAQVDAPGFLSGLESGWAAFVSLLMVAATAVGFFVPFLILLAIVAVPITIVLVRQARRHRRTVVPAPPTREAGPDSDT